MRPSSALNNSYPAGGNILELTLSYLGGNKRHQFELAWLSDLNSDNNTPVIQLIHRGLPAPHNEQCSQILRFDISQLTNQQFPEFELRNQSYSDIPAQKTIAIHRGKD